MVKKFMLICFATVALFSALCQVIIIPKSTSLKKSEKTVVIDAGHGGIDGGVVGLSTGIKEAEINLAVAKALKTHFEAGGFNVVMTRTNEGGLYGATTPGFKERDLKKRVQIAKDAHADLFISVHMNNYSDKNRRGAQVFYKNGCLKSKAYSEEVQKELNGLEESSRSCSVLAGDYYVLNFSECPSFIVECGFLSNEKDERLLLDKDYQIKLTHAIYYGVIKSMLEN